MIVTQSVRLFPTKKQERYFHKACSARTHIFNKAKEWDDLYYAETGKRLTKRELSELIAEYKPEFHRNLPFTIESQTYRDGMLTYFEARRRAFAKKVVGLSTNQINTVELSHSTLELMVVGNFRL